MTKSEESILFSQALAFAAKKHGGQTRKTGVPYIFHPVNVAEYVAVAGADINCQIVALFHDLLEDTDATEEQMREFCDDEMINAIKLLTKTPGYNPDKYIGDILDNPMAKTVKNADRISNLRDSVFCGDVAFMKRYIDDTQKYYQGKFSKELDEALTNLVKFVDGL